MRERPHGPPWAAGGWSGPPRGWGRHMFRRVVGLIVFLVLMGVVLGALVATGISAIDGSRVWLTVGVVVVSLFAFGLMARSMFRRVWSPIGDLIDATRRVGEGDTGVRLTMTRRGPLAAVSHSFNRMAQRLEEDDERRRRLLADLSHELRTPMTVIRGEIEAVLDGLHPGEDLTNVLDEIDLMDRLLDDLRVLAHTEAGSLTLFPEQVDIADVVADVVASMSRRAEAQGVAVVVVPSSPSSVMADPHRIHQVLANLVSNALDQMPEGGSLQVTFSEDGQSVSVAVDDSGPGVPLDEREDVFTRFVKSADSTGTGLGLSISRDLALAHGGSLTVTDAPGGGARFVLTLPNGMIED